MNIEKAWKDEAIVVIYDAVTAKDNKGAREFVRSKDEKAPEVTDRSLEWLRYVKSRFPERNLPAMLKERQQRIVLGRRDWQIS